MQYKSLACTPEHVWKQRLTKCHLLLCDNIVGNTVIVTLNSTLKFQEARVWWWQLPLLMRFTSRTITGGSNCTSYTDPNPQHPPKGTPNWHVVHSPHSCEHLSTPHYITTSCKTTSCHCTHTTCTIAHLHSTLYYTSCHNDGCQCEYEFNEIYEYKFNWNIIGNAHQMTTNQVI